METVPVDRAQAADYGLTLLTANAERELVTELELKALGQLGFNRHAGQAAFTVRIGSPPLTFAEGVALRQVGGPGQAQVALHGTVTGGFLADNLLHGLAVDFSQAPGNNRVERRGLGRKLRQALGKGAFVVGQNVQCEVIWRVLGQLVLPGVEKLGTQQSDQGHGQEDQAESQGLPGGRQRVAQQLA
ncbi:hypothetical protein D3C72_1771630 [compost metagenome]